MYMGVGGKNLKEQSSVVEHWCDVGWRIGRL